MIWGTATDDSLGEDAKVTILATGMEDHLETEVKTNVHSNEDDYYEDLIPQLYRPAKKTTMATVITQQELQFEVEPAKDPEPAVVPDPEPEPDPEPNPEPDTNSEPDNEEPTILKKWKDWLNNLMNVVTE